MWTVEGCSRRVEHTLLEFGHISNSWTGRSIPPSSGTSFGTLNCESDLNCWLPFEIDIELRKSYDYRLYDSQSEHIVNTRRVRLIMTYHDSSSCHKKSWAFLIRSWMINEAGESVLYFDSVHLQEVRDEHLQKAWKECRWL